VKRDYSSIFVISKTLVSKNVKDVILSHFCLYFSRIGKMQRIFELRSVYFLSSYWGEGESIAGVLQVPSILALDH
jgi:hypothetical protein